MKSQSLKIETIVTTAGTQIRAKIDAEAVSDYADAMEEGAKFPPVVVFHDGKQFILADGFHRVMAAERNNCKEIAAEVHNGTKTDALKYALGANSAHGLKRTNADKRCAVLMALKEWPKVSNAEIARICAVSDVMVADVRRSQPQESCGSTEPTKRTGADGKERRLPKPKPSKPKPENPEPPEERGGFVEHGEEELELGEKVDRGADNDYYARQIEAVCAPAITHNEATLDELRSLNIALKDWGMRCDTLVRTMGDSKPV